MGDWTTRTQKRQCFNHGSHVNGVVGVSSGTRESNVSLGGNEGTKHDIGSALEGIGTSHHIQQGFHHERFEYHLYK